MKTYQIKCRFCSNVNGTIELQDDSLVPEIVDSRCDTHKVEFGEYKDMEVKFRREVRGTHEEFLKIMEKAEFKKDKMDVEIEDIIRKKVKNVV